MDNLDGALNRLLDSKTILGDRVMQELLLCPSNDEIVRGLVQQLEDQSKHYNRWNSRSLGNLILIYQSSHSTVLQDKAKETLRGYLEYLQSGHSIPGHPNIEIPGSVYRTLFNSCNS